MLLLANIVISINENVEYTVDVLPKTFSEKFRRLLNYMKRQGLQRTQT